MSINQPTKFAVYSDGHGKLPTIEPCDVFCYVGDILPNFTFDRSKDIALQNNWVLDKFIPWLNSIPCKEIVIVAGNHDLWFEFMGEANVQQILSENCTTTIHYLKDRQITINGIKIYGTPWILPVGNWAFMAEEETMESIMALVPDDAHILLHHCPAKNILDEMYNGQHVGSQSIKERLFNLPNLRYSICGHIHEAAGKEIQEYSCSFNDLSFICINTAETVNYFEMDLNHVN